VNNRSCQPDDWVRLTLRWVIAGDRPGVLEWSIADSSASARFVTTDGSDEFDLILPVSVMRDGTLVHIDAGSALCASIRLGGDGSARVLYARTSMLTKLGATGGRARVDGCEVERATPRADVAPSRPVSSS